MHSAQITATHCVQWHISLFAAKDNLVAGSAHQRQRSIPFARVLGLMLHALTGDKLSISAAHVVGPCWQDI